MSEGRRWLDAALRLPPAQHAESPIPSAAAVRVRALRQASWLARSQGDLGPARALSEQALATARVLEDTPAIAHALRGLAAVVSEQGHELLARTLNEEALARFQQLGVRKEIAIMYHNMGWQAFLAGDAASGLALLEQSLALWQEWGAANISTLCCVGLVALERGGYARAREALMWGMREAATLRGNDDLVYYLEGFAWLAAALSAHQDWPAAGARRAARCFGATEALREVVGGTRIPAEQALHDRHLAAARAHLDQDEWEAAWAEGQAMTLEQAIAYALAIDST